MGTHPIVCTLTDAERAERRSTVLQQLREQVRDRQRAVDGIRLRLDATDTALNIAWQVISLERQCCRFLRFQLTVDPDGGPVWLELTGPPGASDFIDSELAL